MTSENVGDLLSSEFEKREIIFGPWCLAGDYTLLWGPAGLGKTFLAHQIAYAVSTGSPFLKWEAPKMRPVLLVDNELMRRGLFDRLWLLDGSNEKSLKYDGLHIITSESCGGTFWNISDPEAQKKYNQIIEQKKIELIIIDNYFSCAEPILRHDTDLTIWHRIRPWFRHLKKKGVAVILIHHANKDGGQQSGTQLRYNDADIVVQLKAALSEDKYAGSVFDFLFPKGRWFFGKDKEPIRVKYSEGENGKTKWEWKPLQQAIRDYATRKLAAGWSETDLCKVLGINKSQLEDAKKYRTDIELEEQAREFAERSRQTELIAPADPLPFEDPF